MGHNGRFRDIDTAGKWSGLVGQIEKGDLKIMAKSIWMGKMLGRPSACDVDGS